MLDVYVAMALTSSHTPLRDDAASAGPRGGSAAPVDRRRWVIVVVVIAIPYPVPLTVDEAQGLLKETRLRITVRHGAIHDVEPVLVHVNRHERARSVRVIRDLQLVSFDKVDEIPHVVGHFD